KKSQQKHATLVDREQAERRLYLLGALLHEQPGFRRAFIRRQQRRHLRDVQRGSLGLAPELEFLESQLVANQVVRNADQPRADGALAAERLAPLVGLQEAILRDR